MRIFRLLFFVHKRSLPHVELKGISRMLIIVLSRKFSIHSNRSSSLSIFFVDNLEHGSFLWNSLGKYWDFPHFPHNPQVGN